MYFVDRHWNRSACSRSGRRPEISWWGQDRNSAIHMAPSTDPRAQRESHCPVVHGRLCHPALHEPWRERARLQNTRVGGTPCWRTMREKYRYSEKTDDSRRGQRKRQRFISGKFDTEKRKMTECVYETSRRCKRRPRDKTCRQLA